MRFKSGFLAVALGAAVSFGALPVEASAQAGQTIPLRVQAGSTYVMEMQSSVQTLGAPEQDMRLTMTMGLTIEEMGPTGGVWRYSFEDLRLEQFSLPAGPEGPGFELPVGPVLDQTISGALRLISDLDIVCRVDAQGSCLEVTNWPQWRARAEDFTLTVSGIMQLAALMSPSAVGPDGKPAAPGANGGMNPESARLMGAGFESLMGLMLDEVDGQMLASWMRYPGTVTAPAGAFAVGTPQPVSVSYLMPFGAAPLEYGGAMTLEAVDQRAGVARFSRTMEVDSQSFISSMTSLVQNAAPPLMGVLTPLLPEGAMGEDPAATSAFMVSMATAVLASMQVDLEETGTVEVDLATGLVRTSTLRQTVSMRMPDGTSMGDQVTNTTITLRPGVLNQPRLGAAAARP